MEGNTERQKPENELPFRTLAELLALGDEKHEWVWEHYVARGAKTLLSAMPKIGKSTLAAGLTGALLNSEAFLGIPTAPSCAVLFLTEETNITSIVEKLTTCGVNVDDPRLRVLRRVDVNGHTWTAVVKELTTHAVAFREEVNVDDVLVVLDGLSKWGGFENENDSSETEKAINALDLLTAAGCAVFILNHAGWTAKRSRGASGIVGAVDQVLFLDGEAGSQNARGLKYQGGRLHPEPNGVLNIGLREGRPYLLGSGHTKPVAKNLVRVMDMTKDGAAVTDKDVAGKLGVSERTAERYLQELVVSGNLRRSDEQVPGGGGRKVTYRLDEREGFERLLSPDYALSDAALDKVVEQWQQGSRQSGDDAR